MGDHDYAVTSTRFTTALQRCRDRIAEDVTKGVVEEDDDVTCEATVQLPADRPVKLLGSQFLMKGRFSYELQFRAVVEGDRRLEVKEARVVFNHPKESTDDDRPATGKDVKFSKKHFFYCFDTETKAAPAFRDIPADRATVDFMEKVEREDPLLAGVNAAWACAAVNYFNIHQLMVTAGDAEPMILAAIYQDGRLLNNQVKVLTAFLSASVKGHYDLGKLGYYAQPEIKPFLAEMRRQNGDDDVGPALQFVVEQLDGVPHRHYDERLVGGSSITREMATP